MIIFWGVLMVLFLAVEAATVGLASIWFALGALGALICAGVVQSNSLIWLQVLIFLVVSGVTLVATRPLAKRYMTVNRKATNADRVLDMVGVCRETIDNLAGKGAVYVDGKVWTARTHDGSIIQEGSRVHILRIEGVKLIVLPESKEASPVPSGAEK